MSLSFDFPSFQKTWGAAEAPPDSQCEQQEQQRRLLQDLADLDSGDEEAPTPAAAAADDAAAGRAASSTTTTTCPTRAAEMPPTVLQLLVTDHLALPEVASLACACSAWHEAITADSSVWRQQHARLLGNGWPHPPFVGAAPLELPPSLGCSSRLRLKATLATTRVGLQFFVMRKGFEVLLTGFEALWAGLAQSAAAAAAGGGGGGCGGAQQLAPAPSPASVAQLLSPQPRERAHKAYHLPASAASGSSAMCHQVLTLQTSSSLSPSPAAAAAAAGSSTSVSSDRPPAAAAEEEEQQQASGGRQLQRLVDKLARSNWELTYLAYSVALSARCDEIAAQLAGWLDSSLGAAAAGHQGAPQAAAAAAVLADCAGGILFDVEAVAGVTAGELLGPEPELLLAATHRGARPSAIELWQQLLCVWARYRRWLELVAARCGLLGARVAAARQLAEPSSRGPPNAAVLPHLRNKGLLHFRSRVVLCHALRRPLQQAALWLAAAAAAGGASGCSEADLETLVAVRKLLTELDVADSQDEPTEVAVVCGGAWQCRPRIRPVPHTHRGTCNTLLCACSTRPASPGGLHARLVSPS